MSTIGSLLALMDPNIRPYSEGMESVNRAQRGATLHQTELLQLADLKRQQAAEQEVVTAIQSNPALAQQLFGGGSVLGSLGPPPGAAPGAITQSPLGGGPAQTVPAYPDASRYAGVSPQGGGPLPPDVAAQVMPTVTPPQSTLASLGPQPQAQQHPLLEMARRDPRAALLLQQRMQQQEDLQLKRQEQRLTMGTKVMEYLGRGAQGVTDQASLDTFRQDVARVHPQAAAQLPQTYSKEAMAPFIAKALDVKEAMTLQVQDLQAQAAMMKARREQANIPNYTGDAQLDALIYVKMKDQPPGTIPSREIIEAAYQQREADKLRVQKAGVTPQIIEGEGGIKYAVDPHTLERRPIPGWPPGAPTPGTPGPGPPEPMRGPMSADDKKIADYASRMSDSQAKLTELEESGDYTSWKAPLSRLPGGRLALSDRQQQYETAKGLFLQGILRRDSQGQISKQEWDDYSRDYFPQPGEGPEIVKQKQAMRAGAIRAQQAVLGRPGVPQGPPPSQPAPQGPATFDPADFLKWRQGTGKTGNPTAADVQAYFEAKGLHRR